MMKKTYKNPEIEVQVFHTEDIIRTSGLQNSLQSKGVVNVKDVSVDVIFRDSN